MTIYHYVVPFYKKNTK